MSSTDLPQIYLITPTEFELSKFRAQLEDVLDSTAISCVRLSMSSKDEREIGKAADVLRECCHAKDVALVIEHHFRLVEPLGLDGCHLNESAKIIRNVRKDLGQDAILGTFCGESRHNGISAGEAGADYVSFGPLSASALGDGSVAPTELFKWWSEMIEVPVIAEGGITLENIGNIAPFADFLAFGTEIWSTANPAATLKEFLNKIY